jgi:hypothetical protein
MGNNIGHAYGIWFTYYANAVGMTDIVAMEFIPLMMEFIPL